MEKNYFQLFKNETKLIEIRLQTEGIKPSLLLHVCCAPCSSSVIDLLDKMFTITLLFYNPNIFPQKEYERRRDELYRFIRETAGSRIKVREITYNQQEFYEVSRGLETEPERGARCFLCYEQRLLKTAEYANRENFDYFTTALSVSPHKDAKKINEIGQKIAQAYEAKTSDGKTCRFLFADFKKENGYKRSLEISEAYGLYRQSYCGCEFSIKSQM